MRGILYTIYMVLSHIHQCLTLEKKLPPKLKPYVINVDISDFSEKEAGFLANSDSFIFYIFYLF